MQIYHYDPVTYNFTAIGTADPSPLEDGVYLIPAHATDIVPPDFDPAAQTCRFINGRWIVAEMVLPDPDPQSIPPTAAEIEQAAIATLAKQVQTYLDTAAQTNGYDGILSLCTYTASSSHRFAAEGQAGVACRDACWSTYCQIIDDVKAGKRSMPSTDELAAELPPLVWP